MEGNSVEEHNRRFLENLTKGDLVMFPHRNWGYSHWAVYVGGAFVVHKTQDDDEQSSEVSSTNTLCCCSSKNINKSRICHQRFTKAAKRRKGYLGNNLDHQKQPFPPRKIVCNAYSKIGEKGYHILFNNCEHFANWCRYAKAISQQANLLLDISILIVISLGSIFLVAFLFFEG